MPDVMVRATSMFGSVLVGANLTTPAFESDGGGEAIELDREVRVGGAWGSGWPGISR